MRDVEITCPNGPSCSSYCSGNATGRTTPRSARNTTRQRPESTRISREATWGAPKLPDNPSNRMDVWKGEVIAPAEEELLSGIQGGSREDGDRDLASDCPGGEGARYQRRHPR